MLELVQEGDELLCPLRFDLCYPSFNCRDCLFWRNDKCDYEAIVAVEESVGQLATVYPEMSKEDLRLVAQFADFVMKGSLLD